MFRIDFGFGRGFVEIGVWTIINYETELRWEVWEKKGMWELDFVWVCAIRLRWDFLEGENEVEKLIFVMKELGFLGEGVGIGVLPFEKSIHGFMDNLGAHPGGSQSWDWDWIWVMGLVGFGGGHGSKGG